MSNSLLSKNIELEATGIGVKRYINICHHHKIPINNIRCINNTYYFEMNADDYKCSKEYIKTTCIKVRIVRKWGTWFWLNNNRNRYGLLLGILIFIGGLFFLSNFLWKIEINGNLYYSDEVILDFLTENNIKTGAVALINSEELESAIRESFDKVIWVSVSVEGTKLTIDLKENNSNPIMADETAVRDIVATKDGVVESIFVRTGTAIVKPGDEVKKGDVLVTSKVVCANEYGEEVKVVYTNADADIVINTSYDYIDIIKRDYTEKEYTGNVMEEELVRIGNREIETNFKCKYENYDVVVDYTIENNFVPILYGYKYYREYKIVNKSYSDENLTMLLEENLNNYLNILIENGVQITGNSVKIDLNGLEGCASGTINVKEQAITYEEPIITEESEGTKTE